MKQALIELFWPTLIYVVVCAGVIAIYKSGHSDVRHPDRVWIADLFKVSEETRDLIQKTNKIRAVLALILITLAYACVAGVPIQDLFLALKHLGK